MATLLHFSLSSDHKRLDVDFSFQFPLTWIFHAVLIIVDYIAFPFAFPFVFSTFQPLLSVFRLHYYFRKTRSPELTS